MASGPGAMPVLRAGQDQITTASERSGREDIMHHTSFVWRRPGALAPAAALLLALCLFVVGVQAMTALSASVADADGYQYLAQWGNAPPAGGEFNDPYGIAVDSAGNVYVADTSNNRVQKFTLTGTFLAAWGINGSGDGQFYSPEGIAVDSGGNVYVADTRNDRVQKFTSTGTFLTAWGTRGGGDGQFNSPAGIAVDAAGNVYVADTWNDRIQKFNATGGLLTTLANRGSGNGEFIEPSGIAVDRTGNVYVTDEVLDRVQVLAPNGTVIAAWGTDGRDPGQFSSPTGIAVDSAGYVYVADNGNSRVQKFTSSGAFVTTWGALGTEEGQFSFAYPKGIAVDRAGDVYVSASGSIHKYTPDGTFVTAWGSYRTADGEFASPWGIARDSAGNIYVVDAGNDRVQKFTSSGAFLAKWGTQGSGDGQFSYPHDLAIDSAGNVYVPDMIGNRVQKFTSSGTFLTAWGGTRGGGDGQFDGAWGIAVDGAGNVYVVDSFNNRVQKFTSSGVFLAKWGTQGSGDGQFNSPEGIAVDGTGNVFVADTGNNRVQKFTPSGTFLATWGTTGSIDGRFSHPEGIAVDGAGNVFVADTGNNRAQKFTSSGTFLTKWGTLGSGDGQFGQPEGIVVDSAGNVYVADTSNNRVQVFGPSPPPTPTVTVTPPRFVAGDILTIGTNGTVVISGVQSGGAAPVYTAYDAISGAGRWEIPKYWQGDFRVDEPTLVASLHAHRAAHADPVLVIITDPAVTGGDMKVTGLSLAEALSGVAYPVEPAPGEPGSGVPLYVTGDILSNSYAPGGGTLIGGFSNNSQLYSTYDVVKNGDRWEIDNFDFYGFGLPESYLIGSGMRRIAHANPHTVLVNDTASNTGDTTWYRLSFAEYLAGEGYTFENWQEPPSAGDMPRYRVGDVLGTDASTTTGHVVAGIDMTNGAYPIYTTYDAVKNGTRWEIPKFTGGDSLVDAYGVFAQGWHRIDHRDPHFVIVTDRAGTPGGPAYGGLSLGEILGGTPGYLFEAANPAPFTSLTVPGRVQAEDYDLGGEDVAYHDTDAGNNGGVYRHDDVDIEKLAALATPDVGWIRTGEYLVYTVNVTVAGTYTLTARVASPNSGRTMTLSAGGTTLATIAIPNTGSFATFSNVTVPVTLTAGSQALRLTFTGDGQNIDWFELAPVVTSTVIQVPTGAGLPTDTNADGKYDDINGNGRKDFADVVLYFNQMIWIAANEPVAAFDYNGNGRIDFADVVWLFNNL